MLYQKEIFFDWGRSADKTILAYGKENRLFLSLAWYALRWKIEVSYYGKKLLVYAGLLGSDKGRA